MALRGINILIVGSFLTSFAIGLIGRSFTTVKSHQLKCRCATCNHEWEDEKGEQILNLIDSLDSDDNRVIKNAFTAIDNINDPRLLEPLKYALNDENWYVRSRAVEVLEKIEDRKAIKPLIDALRDKYVFVRKKAAETLGKIGDSQAIEPLKEALKDKNGIVQEKAGEALEKIKEKTKYKKD